MSEKQLKQRLKFIKVNDVVPLDDFLILLMFCYGFSLLPYGIIDMLVGDQISFYAGTSLFALIFCLHVYNLLVGFSRFQIFIVGLFLSLLHLGLLIFLCLNAQKISFIWGWFYPGMLVFYCLSNPFFASLFSLIFLPFVIMVLLEIMQLPNLAVFIAAYLSILIFAHIAGLRICSDKEELSNLSFTDALSGLKNRLALKKFLHDSTSPWRSKQIQSVICFEVDKIDEINELLGYSIKDIVIQRLSKLVQKNLVDDQHFYRHPDKGFVLFLSKQEDPVALASQLERLVLENPVLNIQDYPIRISCGLALRSGQVSIKEMMLQAHQKLISKMNNKDEHPHEREA